MILHANTGAQALLALLRSSWLVIYGLSDILNQVLIP